MIDMLETYPHATEVVRAWFVDKMEESFKDKGVPDNFKDFMRQQGVPNDRLVKLFEDNPRVLFDVFDDNDVIINIMYGNDGFIWDVNNVKNIEIYASRRMAEKAAVQRAFQILNNKLNITLNERPDSGTSDSEVSA